MGFFAQAGSVGFKTQSVKGTYVSPGSGGQFIRTRQGALTAQRDLLIPDPEIGGSRDVPDALLGAVKFAGSYEFYSRYDSLASILKYGLGNLVSSTPTGSGGTLVGTHVIKQVDSTNLPWVSVEENIANDYIHFRYTDAKCSTLHFEADANGYLMGTAGFVALSQLRVPNASATASPSYDIGPLTVGTNITLTLNGQSLGAKSFSFDLTNNLEEDDFRLGSLFLGDTVEKRRTLTLGAKIRPSDNALLRQALYGLPTADSAGGLTTKVPTVLTCTSYEFIGTTVTQYSASFTVPVAVIKPFAPTPSGDNVIEHDIEIQALRPDPTVDLITATVVNHVAATV